MIEEVSDENLVAILCDTLGIEEPYSLDRIIRPALRRGVYHLAPTSRAELIRFVFQPLDKLGVDRADIEDALEEAIQYGDILEMIRTSEDPWDAPDTVLRPAPPSFVLRNDMSMVILGVAGQLPSALTPTLDERVSHDGPVRTLNLSDDPPLAARLEDLGLVKVPEKTWLRLPRIVASEDHLAQWEAKLNKLNKTPGGVPDLKVLDPSTSVRYYSGRWSEPRPTFQGLMLVRRPQAYGADLWAIAAFRNGTAERVLDLHGDHIASPSDLGWRFQAALDATLQNPQQLDVRIYGDIAAIDFFSPIPAFAERRLTLVGEKKKVRGTLFSFEMKASAVEHELLSLRQTLWMDSMQDTTEK